MSTMPVKHSKASFYSAIAMNLMFWATVYLAFGSVLFIMQATETAPLAFGLSSVLYLLAYLFFLWDKPKCP